LPLDPFTGPPVDEVAGADQVAADGELVEGVGELALFVGELGGVSQK